MVYEISPTRETHQYDRILQLQKMKDRYNYDGVAFLVDDQCLLPYLALLGSQVICRTLARPQLSAAWPSSS